MGYDSTVHISTVPIEHKTQKEINTRVNEILSMPKFYEVTDHESLYYIPNSITTRPRIEHLRYAFTFRGDLLEVAPIDGDYYGRHYDDFALAFIISKLVSPKGKASLEYTGQDDIQWGYAIERDKIHKINYLSVVTINKKKINLSKWLNS